MREVEEKGVLLQLTRDNPHTPHVNIGTAACSFFDHLPWRGTHFMVAACAQSLCEHFLVLHRIESLHVGDEGAAR